MIIMSHRRMVCAAICLCSLAAGHPEEYLSAILKILCHCVVVEQVILYSEGFVAAKELASKIVSLFTLSSQLLSRQQVLIVTLLKALHKYSSTVSYCCSVLNTWIYITHVTTSHSQQSTALKTTGMTLEQVARDNGECISCIYGMSCSL